MSEPQVTVRSTEAGRVTEVVVPFGRESYQMSLIADVVRNQIPRAEVFYYRDLLAIRQPGGPDVVALAGERLRIAAGRVERMSGDGWPSSV